METEEKYLIKESQMDLEKNYNDYNEDKVDDIISIINTFIDELDEARMNFSQNFKKTINVYERLSAKEKNAIRDHIDKLPSFDIKRYIKGVIW